jgi:hypothetical protein
MKKFNTLLCTTALTAVFTAPSGRAFAGTITETESYANFLATPYTGHVISFLGYTAEGGTNPLLSVVVTATDVVNGTVTGTNSTNTPLTFSAGVKNVLTLSSQPANLTLPVITDFSNTSGVVTVPANGTFTTPTLTGSKVANSTATGSLNDFLGAWSLTFGETGNYVGSAAAGVNLSAATLGDVSVTAVYTFSSNASPVPEPMSAAILGTALTGIGIIRRRRPRT